MVLEDIVHGCLKVQLGGKLLPFTNTEQSLYELFVDYKPRFSNHIVEKMGACCLSDFKHIKRFIVKHH